MISARTLAQADLDHRAFHFAVAEKAGRIMACSPDGSATLLSRDLTSAVSLRLPPKINDIALSPAGDMLAVVESQRISVCNPELGSALS
jgi:hypothetical protein